MMARQAQRLGITGRPHEEIACHMVRFSSTADCSMRDMSGQFAARKLTWAFLDSVRDPKIWRASG